jgi:hypothetical protein
VFQETLRSSNPDIWNKPAHESLQQQQQQQPLVSKSSRGEETLLQLQGEVVSSETSPDEPQSQGEVVEPQLQGEVVEVVPNETSPDKTSTGEIQDAALSSKAVAPLSIASKPETLPLGDTVESNKSVGHVVPEFSVTEDDIRRQVHLLIQHVAASDMEGDEEISAKLKTGCIDDTFHVC